MAYNQKLTTSDQLNRWQAANLISLEQKHQIISLENRLETVNFVAKGSSFMRMLMFHGFFRIHRPDLCRLINFLENNLAPLVKANIITPETQDKILLNEIKYHIRYDRQVITPKRFLQLCGISLIVVGVLAIIGTILGIMMLDPALREQLLNLLN